VFTELHIYPVSQPSSKTHFCQDYYTYRSKERFNTKDVPSEKTKTMATPRRNNTLSPDSLTARFLYTIIKQLDLRSIDWSQVAASLGITNGHAARMRYTRFKQQMEGVTVQPRSSGSGPKKDKVCKEGPEQGKRRKCGARGPVSSECVTLHHGEHSNSAGGAGDEPQRPVKIEMSPDVQSIKSEVEHDPDLAMWHSQRSIKPEPDNCPPPAYCTFPRVDSPASLFSTIPSTNATAPIRTIKPDPDAPFPASHSTLPTSPEDWIANKPTGAQEHQQRPATSLPASSLSTWALSTGHGFPHPRLPIPEAAHAAPAAASAAVPAPAPALASSTDKPPFRDLRSGEPEKEPESGAAAEGPIKVEDVENVVEKEMELEKKKEEEREGVDGDGDVGSDDSWMMID
jgi:hypothetical protein